MQFPSTQHRWLVAIRVSAKLQEAKNQIGFEIAGGDLLNICFSKIRDVVLNPFLRTKKITEKGQKERTVQEGKARKS